MTLNLFFLYHVFNLLSNLISAKLLHCLPPLVRGSFWCLSLSVSCKLCLYSFGCWLVLGIWLLFWMERYMKRRKQWHYFARDDFYIKLITWICLWRCSLRIRKNRVLKLVKTQNQLSNKSITHECNCQFLVVFRPGCFVDSRFDGHLPSIVDSVDQTPKRLSYPTFWSHCNEDKLNNLPFKWVSEVKNYKNVLNSLGNQTKIEKNLRNKLQRNWFSFPKIMKWN